jgi:hypothetical protein
MGYWTGIVGLITCNQDNGGNANDTGTPVNNKPDQFGAALGPQLSNVA